MNDTLPNLLRHAAAVQRQGRRLYACLVVSARGSTPQAAGALMLVDDSGAMLGTIGGGCVEAEVRRHAFDLMLQGRSAVQKFVLNHDYGWDDGLICGGTLEIAICPAPTPESLDAALEALAERRTPVLQFQANAESGSVTYTLRPTPPERLYIAGAGHVGQALARLALSLEFDVSVFDDRADLLDRLVPAGARKVAGDIASQLAASPVGPDTFCVVVTRGHKHDEQALEAVVSRGARYVGMIGSRRKVKLIFDDLRARGVPESELQRVNAPIGLSIGAVSVEEIAISIAAQLVQVRREGRLPIVEASGEGASATGADRCSRVC